MLSAIDPGALLVVQFRCNGGMRSYWPGPLSQVTRLASTPSRPLIGALARVVFLRRPTPPVSLCSSLAREPPALSYYYYFANLRVLKPSPIVHTSLFFCFSSFRKIQNPHIRAQSPPAYFGLLSRIFRIRSRDTRSIDSILT
jgi:hypothetical protein